MPTAQPQAVDLLISARWVIPVEPDRCLDHHSVVVDAGNILAILPEHEAKARFRAREQVELPHHALIPGLVNAHTHAAMSLFRGLADDLPLMDWLQNHIWPAEGRFVSPDFVRDGVALSVAEMLLGGTTCFSDMYFFPEQTAQLAREAGMRVCVGMIMIDFPTPYAQSPDDYLDKGLQLHDRWRSDPFVITSFAPHAPYSVSDGPLEKIRTLNNELNRSIQIHLHETAHEVTEGQAKFGMRPIARLDRLELLNPNLVAVHMTQLLPEEIQRLADTGVHVVHCPESNLKLASGFCPVDALMQAGVNVALGTDGAASNNDLDMFGEMRSAALLAKAVSGSATALSAHQTLRMATLNGAKALGLEARIGSLVAGKAADMVAVDLNRLHSQPVYDPISQLVYTAGREQVSDVWIAGHRRVRDGRLTSLDTDTLLARAAEWRHKIQPD